MPTPRAGTQVPMLPLLATFFVAGVGMTRAGDSATVPPGGASVLRFGAAGDGVSDDTAAIRRALERTGSAKIPAGTYRTTAPIRLAAGQQICGDGVLLVDFDTGSGDASNAAVICAGDSTDVRGVTIRKKFIDGSYGTGILIPSGRRNVAVRDVEIEGYSARYGVHAIESRHIDISGCFIHDFMVNVRTDMIQDSPAGIRLTRCESCTVSCNRVSEIQVGAAGREAVSPLKPDYGPQGYQSDLITVVDCRDIALTGNVLRTSGEGIDLLISRRCSVTGNTIRDIWFQGIKMLGASDCTVTGNVISECYQGIGLTDHDGLGKPCTGNTILGNVVLDTGATGSFGVPAAGRVRYSGTFGIDIHEACDRNVVSGNVVRDTQTVRTMRGAIHVGSGAGNVVEGNVTDE